MLWTPPLCIESYNRVCRSADSKRKSVRDPAEISDEVDDSWRNKGGGVYRGTPQYSTERVGFASQPQRPRENERVDPFNHERDYAEASEEVPTAFGV